MEPRAIQELKGTQVLQVSRVIQALKVSKETQELLELKVYRVIQE